MRVCLALQLQVLLNTRLIQHTLLSFDIMNAIQTFVLFAVVVGVALAGTCQEDCGANCEKTRDQCKAGTGDAQVCDTIFNTCSGVCQEVCGCLVPCKTKCRPDLTKCLAANEDNWFLQWECKTHFTFCDYDCQTQCFGKKAEDGAAGEDKAIAN